jgi:predicted nucleic acid-binding protein
VIVYFDTSAFLPLVIAEAGTAVSTRLWHDADDVVSTHLIVAEAAAAIAQGNRIGRVADVDHSYLQGAASRLIFDATLIDVTTTVIERAAKLAVARGLRGYDSVHLATATLIRAGDVVFASGDQRLLAAASEEGFTTANTNGPLNSAS